jgi:integrase/recombinase XerD
MTASNFPVIMPVANWPEKDQLLWEDARMSGDLFEDSNPASDWSQARCKITEDAYGRYLAWLERRGILDRSSRPGVRVTPDFVIDYVSHLRERLAPVSVVMVLEALHGMIRIFEPTSDWSWLRQVAARLKASARPVRDKRQRCVPLGDLANYGVDLMIAAEDTPRPPTRKAIHYRDGMMIALLASRPIRMRNLLQIQIGTNLLCRDHRFWLKFEADETKTGRPIEEPCPEALTPFIEGYLTCHRKVLLGNANERHSSPVTALWISRYGTPLSEGAIRDQIKNRTKVAFDRSVNPHLFRDCAATSIAIEDPEHVRIAAVILGHSKLSTTEKYYNQACSLEAARMYQSSIERLRRDAKRRLRRPNDERS